MSSVISTTPTSNDVLFASRQFGCPAKDAATISGPVPRKTLIEAVAAGRQCAAVRTARGAITVPEHEPNCSPLLSFKFRSTTGELAVEHSVPLTMSIDDDSTWLTAVQALDTGIVGVGDGELGVEDVLLPPPPP